MQLSAYSDYSLRVLMHAGLRRPERVTVDEVAKTFGISRHHLVKVVHDLGRSGHLEITPLRLPVHFRWTSYLPLAVLHGSLLLRLLSDLANWPPAAPGVPLPTASPSACSR